MFQISIEVRDYECDMQGIINNAIYQNYFEHARHQFLKKKGLNFCELVNNEISIVIYRCEIDYILPVTSDQLITVTVNFERQSKIKGIFTQEIISNNLIHTKGKFYIAAYDSNRKIINLDKIDIQKLCIN